MVSTANSGLFNTINANQGKLNSRKSKDFLWGGMPRRFRNKHITLDTAPLTGKQKKRFIDRLRATQAEERQKDWFALTVSVLLTILILVAVF